MKLLACLLLACWIVVLQIPLDKFQKMSDNDREALRTLTITEFCRLYAEQKGVTRFKIFEDIKDGIWRLHIVPIPAEV